MRRTGAANPGSAPPQSPIRFPKASFGKLWQLALLAPLVEPVVDQKPRHPGHHFPRQPAPGAVEPGVAEDEACQDHRHSLGPGQMPLVGDLPAPGKKLMMDVD